jgi:hypothetical protein
MTKGAVRASQRNPVMKVWGLPMSEGGFGSKALALQAASARARHFRCGSGLEPHLRLPLSSPLLSHLANVGAIAFAGQKRFF